MGEWYNFGKEITLCGDCQTKEFHLHEYLCDMERCPYCAGQMISCNCRYTLNGISEYWNEKDQTVRVASPYYEKGLNKEQEEIYSDLLFQIKEVPFINFQNMCVKCGQLNPVFFRASTEEWLKVSGIYNTQILCENCYKEIKDSVINRNQSPNEILYPKHCVYCGKQKQDNEWVYPLDAWFLIYAKSHRWLYRVLCKSCYSHIKKELAIADKEDFPRLSSEDKEDIEHRRLADKLNQIVQAKYELNQFITLNNRLIFHFEESKNLEEMNCNEITQAEKDLRQIADQYKIAFKMMQEELQHAKELQTKACDLK